MVKGSGLKLIISDVNIENISDIKVCEDNALFYVDNAEVDKLYILG